jgi:hypothetical protein
MRNQLGLMPTNLAENKLSTAKVWASSNGTGRQSTRGFTGLREHNPFSGERWIRRLILLLFDGGLIQRRRINSERTGSWTRRGLVGSFCIGRGNFLVALGRDTLQ